MNTIDRRVMLRALTGLGIGTAVFHRALLAQASTRQVTAEMIQQAEWIAGIELAEEDRKAVARSLQSTLDRIAEMRKVEIGYDVPPALHFHVAPTARHDALAGRGQVLTRDVVVTKPKADDDLAFLSVTELAELVRSKQVSSVELTKLYLDRLQRFDSALKCVVTFTEELAMKQARQADAEIARGSYLGPLHGIPWGAKDLIAYPGYTTTWGATPFQQQELAVKATVAERLEQAGAVLIAKLSLGALAMGDEWFGGTTRNPWNPAQGSSGSSAGSASATAAGLVGFALGSETLGSIVSPCRRCGCTGLRPTFGRVSRHGCMTLAWSMDKIGPICRTVEDCALVFGAIHGHDGADATAMDRPFDWPSPRELRSLRVGYFAQEGQVDEREELRILRDLGVELIPIKLPETLPIWAMTIILNTEAATVFDPLTRANITEGLNRWPTSFRQGEFVPAVEYLRANRLRTLLMREMEQLMTQVDVYVGGDDLALTNLTGHPTAVIPFGFTETTDQPRTPRSLTFTGRLFGETELLAVADAIQNATSFHLEHPTLAS